MLHGFYLIKPEERHTGCALFKCDAESHVNALNKEYPEIYHYVDTIENYVR